MPASPTFAAWPRPLRLIGARLVACIASAALASPAPRAAAQVAVPRDDGMPRATMDPISSRLLFPVATELSETEFEALLPQTVQFENGDGALLRGLWYESAASDRTVLVCMGNTGNCSWFVPFAAILQGGGCDVLLFDWQGYGKSAGAPSLLSLPGDALAAWRFVTEAKGRKPAQVGLLGISLGSVVALQLAATLQPAACAVEDLFFPDEQLAAAVGTPDSTAARVALAALKALVLPQIDPRVNAQRYGGPLFLLHGDADWLLTPMATVRLFAQRPERTRAWLMAGTGHSPDSLQVDEWEYRDQLRRFFADAFAAAEGGTPLPLEPQASVAVVQAEPLRLRVEVTAARAGAVQIALARGCEGAAPLDAFYERRLVAAGTTAFECDAPFVPEHVIATEMFRALPRGDGTFEPELSPVSQSLADYLELEREWGRRSGEVVVNAVLPGPADSRIEQRLRGGVDWVWLRPRLPDFEEVDPRIRPRYAELLAWMAFDLETSERFGAGDGLREVRHALVDFLPAEPLRFVTLGNARIDVGFDEPMVVRQLVAAWADAVARGEFATARQFWQVVKRFVPELDRATGLPTPPRPGDQPASTGGPSGK